ncbi:cellulase family glycosylhydrolase [Chitinispirillales bacterium ANBcel5]|uniref:cellulase family glycosylhydrolase n=1 Tax=Cellulosispirillum alkaliphilum TaxID=3039283 RepID=UPI002A56C5EF|nr:cellulase family glycosylhydrolase [Chitinispirillales bacterium ANBcel5]
MNLAKLFSGAMVSTLLLVALSFAETPVERHGRLRVEGNQIVGENDDPVQLMGMSLYWSIWGPQKYYNRDVVNWLVEDWRIDVIRAAMAVDEESADGQWQWGWVYDKEGQRALVDSVIEAAIDNGIYVIVDWHTHDIHLDEAIEFFSEITEKYGDYPNLIWEIFNEPVSQSWNDIAAYSEEVIEAIRENSDNLVIAGTRFYSQFVNEPAANPLSDDNTAYALHFYSGTHGSALRSRADGALDDGIAIFLSEWGTSDASGGRTDRTVYAEESDVWIEWAVDNNISMANWSLGDIDEASAALLPGTSTEGGWDVENDLTESGRYIREKIRSINIDKYGERAPRLLMSVEGPGEIEVTPERDEYDIGDTVTIRAIADEGAQFIAWRGSISDESEEITIVMDAPKKLIGSFYDFPDPILTNGDFSDGTDGWSFYAHTSADAEAEITAEDNQVRIDIDNEGEEVWHVQLFQGNVVLINGFNYQLSFDAAADGVRDILISYKHNGDPWTEYKAKTVTIGPEMQTHVVELAMDETDDNARIEFNLGESSNESVTLANVELKIVDELLPIGRTFAAQRTNNNFLNITHRAASPVIDINFEVNGNSGADLKIIDLRSRVVERHAVTGSGRMVREFDTSNHSAGLYFVVLRNAGKILTERFMIVK